MYLSKADVIELYNIRRQAMLRAVEEGARKEGFCDDFRTDTIGAHVLSEWERQWRGGRFNWREEYADFRHHTRFSVALWCGDTLCGLALGLPSGRKNKTMGVARLEGNPDPAHPLKRKVTGLVIAAATAYGKLLKSQRVRFWDPDPDLTGWYGDHLMHCVSPGNDLLGYCDLAI